jgi:NADPH-dependent glutamate synthase beta subunit-like oxidoreductase
MEEQIALNKRVPMRMLPWNEAAKTFDEFATGYSKADAIAEAKRGAGYDLSAATAKCPFGVDVAELRRLIAAGEFEAAYEVVMRSHPWPGILGRACFRTCEGHRGPNDEEPLFVSALERAAADHGAAGRPPFRPAPDTGRRVAVLGAGSAGSAVAYGLRRRGDAVDMFDQLPVGGGMMTIGYPDFRLPGSVVQHDICFGDWGVRTHFGTPLDRALVDTLLRNYDAVVAATGKFKGIPAELPGQELAGFYDALAYLTGFKTGSPYPLGGEVVVLGAGYAAMDVSRTVRRLGHNATIYYRRSKAEMPVDQSRADGYVRMLNGEGIDYIFQVAPKRILGRDGKVVGIELVRTEPGPADASGRPTPRPVPGSEFVVPCTNVIAALGELCDLAFLPDGIRQTRDGHVRVDDGTFETSVLHLFAVGEMTGAKGTAAAFHAGLLCAEAVHQAITRRDG